MLAKYTTLSITLTLGMGIMVSVVYLAGYYFGQKVETDPLHPLGQAVQGLHLAVVQHHGVEEAVGRGEDGQ